MKPSVIRLDDELGKRLGLTSDQFEDAFVWDCRPDYLGVVRLRPKTPQALENFFQLGSKIYSTIVITAPEEYMITMSERFGYVLETDQAGTPYLTDASSKSLSRQRIEELTKTAKK